MFILLTCLDVAENTTSSVAIGDRHFLRFLYPDRSVSFPF